METSASYDARSAPSSYPTAEGTVFARCSTFFRSPTKSPALIQNLTAV
ncbi:MAG: hypothetical protein QOJ42_7690, partial [Acidobacteriaceae bacterium]|nr:hypothetical protein [Acidobacteriaceae bacterium]